MLTGWVPATAGVTVQMRSSTSCDDASVAEVIVQYNVDCLRRGLGRTDNLRSQ